MNYEKVYNYVTVALIVFIAGLIVSLLLFFDTDKAVSVLTSYLYLPTAEMFKKTVFTPIFVIAIALILILERYLPVNRKQKSFSVGFLQDGIWLIFGLLFEGIVVTVYAGWLTRLSETYLSFLTIGSIEQWPEYSRFIIGIFLTDFLAWFQHWVKHKVPWFWYIHAIHHSQREINLFTDFRFHFMEYIISRAIVLVPLVALGISTPKIVIFAVFSTWLTRFYHANIRTNLGIFRYVFVTPQSHRVHHSIEKSHQDLNFGVIFSIWDRIFGTQCDDHEVYPQTGINDSSFPLEQETSLLSLIMTPIQQLIYPFILMAKSFKRRLMKG